MAQKCHYALVKSKSQLGLLHLNARYVPVMNRLPQSTDVCLFNETDWWASWSFSASKRLTTTVDSVIRLACADPCVHWNTP